MNILHTINVKNIHETQNFIFVIMKIKKGICFILSVFPIYLYSSLLTDVLNPVQITPLELVFTVFFL